jgi:hypothetical protein
LSKIRGEDGEERRKARGRGKGGREGGGQEISFISSFLHAVNIHWNYFEN